MDSRQCCGRPRDPATHPRLVRRGGDRVSRPLEGLEAGHGEHRAHNDRIRETAVAPAVLAGRRPPDFQRRVAKRPRCRGHPGPAHGRRDLRGLPAARLRGALRVHGRPRHAVAAGRPPARGVCDGGQRREARLHPDRRRRRQRLSADSCIRASRRPAARGHVERRADARFRRKAHRRVRHRSRDRIDVLRHDRVGDRRHGPSRRRRRARDGRQHRWTGGRLARVEWRRAREGQDPAGRTRRRRLLDRPRPLHAQRRNDPAQQGRHRPAAPDLPPAVEYLRRHARLRRRRHDRSHPGRREPVRELHRATDHRQAIPERLRRHGNDRRRRESLHLHSRSRRGRLVQHRHLDRGRGSLRLAPPHHARQRPAGRRAVRWWRRRVGHRPARPARWLLHEGWFLRFAAGSRRLARRKARRLGLRPSARQTDDRPIPRKCVFLLFPDPQCGRRCRRALSERCHALRPAPLWRQRTRRRSLALVNVHPAAGRRRH